MLLKAEKGEAGGVCSRCGKCCEVIAFGMAYGGLDWNEYYWARGCKIEPPVGLVVPSRCPHLQFDELVGLYRCDIYDTRPQLCRWDNSKGNIRFYRPPGCTR